MTTSCVPAGHPSPGPLPARSSRRGENPIRSGLRARFTASAAHRSLSCTSSARRGICPPSGTAPRLQRSTPARSPPPPRSLWGRSGRGRPAGAADLRRTVALPNPSDPRLQPSPHPRPPSSSAGASAAVRVTPIRCVHPCQTGRRDARSPVQGATRSPTAVRISVLVPPAPRHPMRAFLRLIPLLVRRPRCACCPARGGRAAHGAHPAAVRGARRSSRERR